MAAAEGGGVEAQRRLLETMSQTSVLVATDGDGRTLPPIERGGRTYAAAFSSARALLATRPPGMGVLEVPGTALSELLPEGWWLVLDAGTLHVTELSPGALAEVAALRP